MQIPPGYREQGWLLCCVHSTCRSAQGAEPTERGWLGRVTGGSCCILNLWGLGALVCAQSVSPVSRWLSLSTGSTRDGASTPSQQEATDSAQVTMMHFRGRPRTWPSFQSSFRLQFGILYSIRGVVAPPTPAQPALLSSTLCVSDLGTFSCLCLGRWASAGCSSGPF